MDSNQYDKLIDIISGNNFIIKKLPLVIGSLSKYDELNINNQYELEKFVGTTISVNKDQLSKICYPLDSENNFKVIKNIQSKLIISTCPIIYPYDIIINKEENKNEYKLLSFGRAQINGKEINSNEFININSHDIISYNCILCNHQHVYIFITKKIGNISTKNYSGLYSEDFLNSNKEIHDFDKNNDYENLNKNNCIELDEDYNNKIGNNNYYNLSNEFELFYPKYPANETIPLSWKAFEKDILKKNILLYGYNRWNTIRTNSTGLLNSKTDQELKIYSNSFIRCIIKLSKDKKDIIHFLFNLIKEKDNEQWITPNPNDWGDIIFQRAAAWGKRLKYLFYIKNTIDIFKSLKASNKDKKKILNSLKEYLPEEEKIKINTKIKANSIYDNWCNLFWFLPKDLLFGQTPVMWWTTIHDIDLMRGTYKYGYANYSAIKSDQKLSFSKLDQNILSKEFPSADSITRRLKKIVQIIIKYWNNNIYTANWNNDNLNYINIDNNKNVLSNEQKIGILEFLINYGTSLKNGGDGNSVALYEKLKENKIFDEIIEKDEINLLLYNIKQFILQIKQKIKEKIKKIDENKNNDYNKNNIFEDDLNISYDKAKLFLNNIRIFEIIRKNICVKNFKLFNENIGELIKVNAEKGLPEKCRKNNIWNCAINDKMLIYFIEEYGLSYLKDKINDIDIFKKSNMSYDEYIQRINFLVDFFQKIAQQNKLKDLSKENENTVNKSNVIIPV